MVLSLRSPRRFGDSCLRLKSRTARVLRGISVVMPRLRNIVRSSGARHRGTIMATIYISLLDEGTDVWRPISGERVFDKPYRITVTPPDDTEKCTFTTGVKLQHVIPKGATLN